MNKRKFFGTILGLIFWSFCVVFFTYAYYDWKSNPTNVVLGIEDLNVECLVGADVSATNIGPVLNYQDGVKVEFSIENPMLDNMAIELYLNITSISDVSLLNESLKYVLVAYSTGDTNYDYNNPVRTGDFSNFNVGNNLITQDLEVTASTTTNYQFIIYIDGNMYNNPNIQENSLIANLLVGNCDEDAVQYDDLVYQAIYSATDNSLTFVHTTPLAVGDTYNDKAVTTVYTGFDTAYYTSVTDVPWYSVRENITSVIFDSVIKPKSTARWFYGFSNLTNINLEKLDMSNVADMRWMLEGCSSLTNLDLSEWNTSKVTNMRGILKGCSSLTSLNLSGWNTSNVTDMGEMFQGCSSLIELDITHFDTSKVTNMRGMFFDCNSLISLDLSSFDTTKVTDMGYMFYNCRGFTSLDLSNFNTSNVTQMDCIFQYCINLIRLDLSNFDTSNAISVSGMFVQCFALEEIKINKLDTKSATKMGYMFGWCQKLKFEILIENPSTSDYTDMFTYAATSQSANAQIIVNYTPETSDLVDSMIATKSSNSNVVKGSCIGDTCPA